MSTWEFTLVVEGPDLQEEDLLERLFAAGLSDATVGRVAGAQMVEVAREAGSYPDALFGAVRALLQTVPEARVVRIEPDELVTIAEIAQRYGRSPESVRLLAAGERGPGGFPAAVWTEQPRMWRRAAVDQWFAAALDEQPAEPVEAEVERLNAAVNARIEWERCRKRLDARAAAELDATFPQAS